MRKAGKFGWDVCCSLFRGPESWTTVVLQWLQYTSVVMDAASFEFKPENYASRVKALSDSLAGNQLVQFSLPSVFLIAHGITAFSYRQTKKKFGRLLMHFIFVHGITEENVFSELPLFRPRSRRGTTRTIIVLGSETINILTQPDTGTTAKPNIRLSSVY